MKCIVYFWIVSVSLLSSSCVNDIKFDAEQWMKGHDPVFPPPERGHMVNDLIKNYHLRGLTYAQLVELLGDPDAYDSSLIIYNIEIDFGSNIDPIYTKDLEFSLSSDSTVTSFKIEEWRK